MIKFSIGAKNFKTMVDKVSTVIPKKSCIPAVTRIYFKVENGNLYAMGTDVDQWLSVCTDDVWMLSEGIIGIDIEDVKLIAKMKDDITFTEVEAMPEQRKVTVKSGKKSITMMGYDNDADFDMPTVNRNHELIMRVSEAWMHETLTNLSIFTGDSEYNDLLHVFNFNTEVGRVEVVDGHRIAMRSIDEGNILTTKGSVMLHNMCVSIMKKVLDKKSDSEIVVITDDKHIIISGNDFKYMQHKIKTEKYFDVKNMLIDNRCDIAFSFRADRENMLEVMEYDANICKETKYTSAMPILFGKVFDELFVYTKTARYEVADMLETTNLEWRDDFFIAFNPSFLVDVLKVIDSDNPEFYGVGCKSPMMIVGNEYSFLNLPVNINVMTVGNEQMVNYIKKQEAA